MNATNTGRKIIMKKAISVLMIAACMLCMVTACEKRIKREMTHQQLRKQKQIARQQSV